MSLEYTKGGKKIECRALYERIKAGQIVVLTFVEFGKDHPLFQYPQPAVFTVVSCKAELIDIIILRDRDGKEVRLSDRISGYLYDAHEWIEWNQGREEEKIARKEGKIKQLEGHVDLLRDILVRQGVKVISTDQAKLLGIQFSGMLTI